MTELESEILTLDEVAGYLNADKPAVCRCAAERKLSASRLGSMWRFRRSDLDEWMAANLTNQDSGTSD